MFMSKKKKITLEEAKSLYAKNESVREFLESKFSKEELTANTTPQEKEETLEQKFKRVWEEKILTQCSCVQFMDANGVPVKTPTPHIQVVDREGIWLFDYDYSSKNKHFYYADHSVYSVLSKEVSSDVDDIQGCIKSWVETTLGIQGLTTAKVEGHFLDAFKWLTAGSLSCKRSLITWPSHWGAHL
jgi:hypothetical protein